MQTDSIRLAAFELSHLDGALELSRQAGWPHRREDWSLLRDLGTGTVAIDGTRIVGTAMATLFGTDSATINMVIVGEAMRGRGLGRRLMETALAAAAGRECRLVATEEGLPLYEKLGFRRTGRILQHQGRAQTLDLALRYDIAWTADASAEALGRMDRAACGLDRSALIGRLLSEARLAVLTRNDAPAGFAFLRPFGRGEVIGPVVAANAEEAKALIAFAIAARPGAFLRIDTVEETALSPWLEAQGLAHVGGGIAMRRAGPACGAPSPTNVQTFALAAQALG